MPPGRPETSRDWLPPLLLGLLTLLWMWAAWDPLDRSDWLLENLLVFLCVPLLVFTYRWHRFKDSSYVLLFVFLSLHIIGSHWTYSNVPWPKWTEMGFERNHYDRVVHFCYGLLLALPAREIISRLLGKPGLAASYVTVEFLLATSALYEIIEWGAVVVVAPDLGAKFLGAQGDEFDAVKDMALAGAGALLTILGYEAVRRGRRGQARAATL